MKTPMNPHHGTRGGGVIPGFDMWLLPAPSDRGPETPSREGDGQPAGGGVWPGKMSGLAISSREQNVIDIIAAEVEISCVSWSVEGD